MKNAREASSARPRFLLDRRTVHLVGMVGALVLAGIGYLLGIAPLAAERREARAHRARIESARVDTEQALSDLAQARARLLALDAEEQPDLVPADRLRETMLGTAHGVGVDLFDLVIGTPEPAAGLLRTSVEAQGEATFSDIVRLLDRFRADMPGVSVDGLSIMRENEGTAPLSVHLVLSSYSPQASPSTPDTGPSSDAAAPSAAANR